MNKNKPDYLAPVAETFVVRFEGNIMSPPNIKIDPDGPSIGDDDGDGYLDLD